MGEEKAKRKRRPFYLLINKEFQIKFTFHFVLLMFLSILLIWSTIFLIFEMNASKIADQRLLQDVLRSIISATNFFFFWEGLIILALGSILALVVSREIIGPLYRIEQDVRAFNKNPSTVREIRIRKGDYFQGLVKELNELLEKLKKK